MGKTRLYDLTNQQPILVPKSHDFWILPEQFAGVEIEIESYNKAQVNKLVRTSSLWVAKEDGSLRDGIELVMSQALMGEQLRDALDMFFGTVKNYSTGPRTSIHVHMNMRQESDTLEVLRNMVVLYYMYEDAFFAIADNNRKWCSYCNPFEDSPPPPLVTVLRGDSLADIRHALASSDSNHNRYYGMNLYSLVRYGTVEFRHLPCTKDKQVVVDWIQLLMELKQAAMILADKDVSPFETFTDVSMLAVLNSLMPKFGRQLRGLVRDEDAYRRMGLASIYRAGDIQSYGRIGGANKMFTAYLKKAVGQDVKAQTLGGKKKVLEDFAQPFTTRLDVARRREAVPTQDVAPGGWVSSGQAGIVSTDATPGLSPEQITRLNEMRRRDIERQEEMIRVEEMRRIARGANPPRVELQRVVTPRMPVADFDPEENN